MMKAMITYTRQNVQTVEQEDLKRLKVRIMPCVRGISV